MHTIKSKYASLHVEPSAEVVFREGVEFACRYMMYALKEYTEAWTNAPSQMTAEEAIQILEREWCRLNEKPYDPENTLV